MGEEVIFNYELDERRCGECRYYYWYYVENKKYGCSSDKYAKVCGSFVYAAEDYRIIET